METTQQQNNVDDLPSVDSAVNAVAGEIEPVAKSERAGSGSYSYRGIDRILDALAPIMARHQVTVVPKQVSDVHHEWVPSPSRSNPDRVEGFTSGTYTFEVRGPRGSVDSYTGQYHAQGMNDRDKSPGSMASYAWRNFVCLLFRIPTAQSDAEARDENPVTTEPTIDDHQIDQIRKLFEQIDDDDRRTEAKYEFLNAFEIGRPSELPKSRFVQAINFVSTRLPEPFGTTTETDNEPDSETDNPAADNEPAATGADEPLPETDNEPAGDGVDPVTGLTDAEAAVLEALLAIGSGTSGQIAEALGKSDSARLRTLLAGLAERELIELDPDAEQGRGPLRVYRRNEQAIAAAETAAETENQS